MRALSLRTASAFVAVLLLSPFGASAEETDGLRQTIRLAHRALQQNNPAMALELIRQVSQVGLGGSDRNAATAVSKTEDALGAKLLSLQQAAERRLSPGFDSGALTSVMPTVLWLDGDNSPGIACRSALASTPGRTARVHLDASSDGHDAIWLRWRAPAPGAYVVTATSPGADASLQAYSECGDSQPIAANDDHDGLDAQMLISAGHAGQVFMVKVANVGDPGDVEISSASTKTISGIVRDVEGSPLQDIRVAVYDATQQFHIATTITDTAGRYTVAIWGEQPGPFMLRTGEQNEPLFLHEAWPDVPCHSAYWTSMESCVQPRSVDIGESGSRTGIDFELGGGAVLSGRVAAAIDGLPIAGAEVTLASGPGFGGRWAVTDVAGRYQFRALAPGAQVRIGVSHEEFAAQMHAGLPCDVHGYGCDLSLATPVVIQGTGTIVDFSLQPQSFIDVEVHGDEDFVDFTSFAVYHANGAVVVATGQRELGANRYRIGPLEPGSYLIKASTHWSTFAQMYPGIDCEWDCASELERAVPVVIESVGSRPSISMTLRRLPRLTGRVTDASTGLPIEAEVRVVQPGFFAPFGTALSDVEGRYEVRGVGQGVHFVTVSARGYVNQIHPAIDCESHQPITSCAGATTVGFGLTTGDQQIDFALRRSPAVVGRMLGDGQPLQPEHFEPDNVMLLGPEGDELWGTTLRFDIATGNYRLTDYPLDSYFVGGRASGYHAQLADGVHCPGSWYWYDCPFQDARRYVLGERDVTIDFDLRGFGLRYVQVRNAESLLPLAGVSVDVWDLAGRPLGTYVTNTSGRTAISAAIDARLSTDNYQGYVDQVHAEIECPEGRSAYRGGCSLVGAETVTLPNYDHAAPDIVFSLRKGVLIFGDGFE